MRPLRWNTLAGLAAIASLVAALNVQPPAAKAAAAAAGAAGASGSSSSGAASGATGTSGSSSSGATGGPSGSTGTGGDSGGNSGGGRSPGSIYQTPGGGRFANPTLRAVRMLSLQSQESIAQCSDDSPDCVADALDNYAAALRQIDLPPDLQALPTVVATAAKKVRQARTRQEAVRAVKVAIAEVHKTIDLIKADDPVSQRVETREGAFVAQTLQVADAKLEKAMGL